MQTNDAPTPLHLFNVPTKDLHDALYVAAMGTEAPDGLAAKATEAIEGGAQLSMHPAFRHEPLKMAAWAMKRSELHFKAFLPVAMELLPEASIESQQVLANSLPFLPRVHDAHPLVKGLRARGVGMDAEVASLIRSEVGMGDAKDKKIAASIDTAAALGWVPTDTRACGLLFEELITHHCTRGLDRLVALFEQHDAPLPTRAGDRTLLGIVDTQLQIAGKRARKKCATLRSMGERMLHSGLLERADGDEDWPWVGAALIEGQARRLQRQTPTSEARRRRPRF